jgi:hypothetical protein
MLSCSEWISENQKRYKLKILETYVGGPKRNRNFVIKNGVFSFEIVSK